MKPSKQIVYGLGFVVLLSACASSLWRKNNVDADSTSADYSANEGLDRKVSSIAPPANAPVDLLRDASAFLKIDSAEIVMENDLAFQRKIQILQSAGAGSVVRLIYYIYSDDQSSSYFSKEIVAAGKRGAKVKLLVDYFTNYKNLDHFSMMERESGNNLSVRFYNRPTTNMLKDIVYMTSPCQKPSEFNNCPEYKSQIVGQMFASEGNYSNINNGMSGLFFSGLYEKDPKLMAMAVLQGQQLDLAKIKGGSGPAMSDADKADLKKVLKLYWTAKTSNDKVEQLGAYLKLAFAKILFGDKLNPIFNAVESVLPTGMDRIKGSAADWAYWTDFTHHKIIFAQNKRGNDLMMIGGRNIENSYHMNPNPMVEKYLFWDTDLYMSLEDGGDQVARSFDELFNFRQMVASIDEIRKHAPNDVAANSRITLQRCVEKVAAAAGHASHASGADRVPASAGSNSQTWESVELVDSPAMSVQMTAEEAKAKTAKAEFKKKVVACVAEDSNAAPLSLAERMEVRKQRLESRASEFKEKVVSGSGSRTVYKSGTRIFADLPGVIPVSKADLQSGIAAYIENLPYNRAVPANQRVRSLGTSNLKSIVQGKHIHAQWIEGFERVCLQSQKENVPKDIYLFNAYFMPPTNVLMAWRDLYDQRKFLERKRLDCSRVTIRIITNSPASTDLGPINALAALQMRGFFQHYAQKGDMKVAPRFEIYEVNGVSSSAHISLHSKVSVFGDDVMVGSANTDLRSFVMDTNNAVMLRDAKDTAARYRAFFAALLAKPGRVTRIDHPLRQGSSTRGAKADPYKVGTTEYTLSKIVEVNRLGFTQFMNKYNMNKHLKPQQLREIEQFYDNLLRDSYNKTVDALELKPGADDEFNDIFKVF